MRLIVSTQLNVFDELQSEWNDLVQRSTSNRIFSTWEWKSTWWEAYEPGRLWIITCRDENDRLLGIAPWFIGDNVERGRVVSTIGCKEVTDYLDVIIDKEHVEAVLNCFVGFLKDNAHQFDRLEFCNIAEDSTSYQNLPAVLRAHGFTIDISLEDVCPVIELPTTWEAYLNLLDKKQRHELRRKLRRSQGVNSEIDWYIVGAQHNIHEQIDRFLDLMAASDPDKQIFLQNPQNVAFFKSIAQVLHNKGWLQLNFLTIEGNPAAAYLNFDYQGHILVYNSGLLPDQYGHLSPGIILLANNIRHAIETRHTVFDFLQGDEAYKYHMGGQSTHVYNLNVHLEKS